MTPSGHFIALALTVGTLALTAGAEVREGRENPLVWDAMEKTIDAKPGDAAAAFTFHVTNQGAQPVTIRDARPSCSCTVAELPRVPWTLDAGKGGEITGTISFAGKDGSLTKSIEITSSAGTQTLRITVNIPPPGEAQRERNRQLAAANRQAVFQGDCATCHAAPTVAKTGGELFQTACLICHVSAHRASMVPDLLVAREHRDAAFWSRWITEGRAGSLMPAFATERGGPLTRAQIESLVDFALKQLPTEPRANN